MEKIGRVLRDPYGGRGLLMVEGKQYSFLVDGLWRSEQPAKPGLAVNVGFDAQGKLRSITAVPESQIRPQDEGARFTIAPLGTSADISGRPSSLISIGATTLLLLTWIFVSAVSIHLPLLGKFDLTVWQILGALNAGNLPSIPEVADSSDPGILGFMAVLALAGPILPFLWRDRRALLGGVVPLGFLGFVACLLRGILRSTIAAQAAGPDSQTYLHSGTFHAISLGFGGYVSVTLAIYCAVVSVKQFMGMRRAWKEKEGRSGGTVR